MKKKAKTASGASLDTVVKLVAGIVGVATLGFGIYQFTTRFQGEQHKLQQDLYREQYKLKQDLYAKAMNSASDFANASTQDEADKAKKAFWELYYGQLSAVENNDVKVAMQTLGGAITKWEQSNDPEDFSPPAEFKYSPDGSKQSFSVPELSYRLTQACRADLGIK